MSVKLRIFIVIIDGWEKVMLDHFIKFTDDSPSSLKSLTDRAEISLAIQHIFVLF